MLISVIVCIFNRAAHLKSALKHGLAEYPICRDLFEHTFLRHRINRLGLWLAYVQTVPVLLRRKADGT